MPEPLTDFRKMEMGRQLCLCVRIEHTNRLHLHADCIVLIFFMLLEPDLQNADSAKNGCFVTVFLFLFMQGKFIG